MAQSSALPWQDAPEDLDILSGLESLPIWTSQALETNAPFMLDNLDTAAPAVSSSFPPLSSAEGEALLSLFGEQLQAQAAQPAQYPSASLPQTYSVTSSFVRDMPTVDLGMLTAQQQGDPSSYPLNPFLGTRRLTDSQELAQPHSEDMELSFLASMGIANPPAKRGRSSLEVSRSVDSLQTGGQRPQALPLRSTASWQQEAFSGSVAQALGGPSRSRQLQVREGQRRFSAPDPHPSPGAFFQVPEKQGPALPIRIQPHGLQNPGASQATGTFGSASPVPFDLGSFPSGASQDRPATSRVAYRIRTNALTRRRSNSESRLQERVEDQDRDQSRDVASFHSEGAISNPPRSAASSEQTPSRPVDSEDSSGAGQPMSDTTALTGASNEPPLMVHPGKLARFLTQLQTIQTKVTRLQQERQTVAEKADMLQRGSSMMSQLVDELDGMQASGASIDQREAKLKAATSDLKQLLAAVTAGAPQLQPAAGTSSQPIAGPSSQPLAGTSSQPIAGPSSQPSSQLTAPTTAPSATATATATSSQGAQPMETSAGPAQASAPLPDKNLQQAMETEDE